MHSLERLRNISRNIAQDTQEVSDAVERIASTISAFGLADSTGATLTVSQAVALAAKAVHSIARGLGVFAASKDGATYPDKRTATLAFIVNHAFFDALRHELAPYEDRTANVIVGRAEPLEIAALCSGESAKKLLKGQSFLLETYALQLARSLRISTTLGITGAELAEKVSQRAKLNFRDLIARKDEPYTWLRNLLINEILAETNPSDGSELDNYAAAVRRRFRNIKLPTGASKANQPTVIPISAVFIEPDISYHELPGYRQLPPNVRAMDGAAEPVFLPGKDADPSKPIPDFKVRTVPRFGTPTEDETRETGDSRNLRAMEFTLDPNFSRVVILGGSGSGKSTLLYKIMMDWTESRVGPIPLLIELLDYSRQRSGNSRVTDFFSYLESSTSTPWTLDSTLTKELIDTGRAVLLLDGYDEVTNEDLKKEIASLLSRITLNGVARVVVTTRPDGFKAEQFHEMNFRCGELRPFDVEHIETFLKKWHKIQNSPASVHRRVVRQVTNDSQLRQIAGTPLLLTQLALLSGEESLPTNRAVVLRRCADLLVHYWECSAKGMPPGPVTPENSTSNLQLTLDEKRAMLRQVAAVMFDANTPAEDAAVQESTLIDTLALAWPEWVDPRFHKRCAHGLVSQLETRNYILVRSGRGCFSFIHRCFADHFFADYLLNESHRSTDLYQRDRITSLIQRNWRSNRLRSALSLYLCDLEVSAFSTTMEPLLSMKVSSELEAIDLIEFIVYCIGLRRPRETPSGLESDMRRLCTVLVVNPSKAPLIARFGQLANAYPETFWFERCERMVAIICSAWGYTSEVEAWVYSQMAEHPLAEVRGVCQRELSKLKPHDAAFVEALRLRVAGDPHPHMRELALKAFVAEVEADDTVRAVLTDRVRHETAHHVLELAVTLFLDRWAFDKTLWQSLAERTTADSPSDIRIAAIRLLSRHGSREKLVVLLQNLSKETEMVVADEAHRLLEAATSN